MEHQTLDCFQETGWSGPFDLLSQVEACTLNGYLQDSTRPVPSHWEKGLGAVDRMVYQLASDQRLLALVRPLLGDNIILWGASVAERSPGELHPWHTDIETFDTGGKAVTVWIALENASPDSSLQLISGSHRFDKCLQQVAAEQGIAREDRSAETSLQLAKLVCEDAKLAQPAAEDGQAVIFDGRVWHGSLNRRREGSRRALLLQYASSDTEIRIPNWQQLEWPFELRSSPRPPVVAVAGLASTQLNQVVPPPPEQTAGTSALKSLAVDMPQPLSRDTDKGWCQSPLYRGSTPVLNRLSCHASVLEPGQTPHPPHRHLEEEILVILEGEAEIVIASSANDPAPRAEHVVAGDLVYYPSYCYHTIRCAAESPVSYFMYRWKASLKPDGGSAPTEITVLRAATLEAFEGQSGFQTANVFESPTGLLRLLHIHLSCAHAGGGYKEHRDMHDVAILMLEGSVKTMGKLVEAPAVVFYPATQLHGLVGASDSPARYLVVEFHGPHRKPLSVLDSMRWTVTTNLGRSKKKIRRTLRSLRRRVIYGGSS